MKKIIFSVSLVAIILFLEVNLWAAGEKEEETKVMEISWLGRGDGTSIMEGNFAQKKIEEKFNVKIKNVPIDWYNEEQVNLLMASGEMPDVISEGVHRPVIDVYKEGVIRSIPRDFILEYYPSHAKLLDNYPPGSRLALKPGTDDEYLCLTGINLIFENLGHTSALRLDWLEKVGLYPEDKELISIYDRIWFTKESFTLAQMERILDAFRNMDPDGNGKKDTFGMTASNNIVRSYSGIMGMFGYFAEYNISYEGKLYPGWISPHHKDFLKLMNEWYKNGWIDQEFATLNHTKFWDKITDGVIGWLTSCPYNYVDPGRAIFYARPPISVLKKNENAKWLISPTPYGPEGKRGDASERPVDAYETERGVLIGKQVDDEKLKKILQIQEWMNYDEEGMAWLYFGEPGVHFEWQGEPYNSKPFAKPGVDVGKEGIQYYTADYKAELMQRIMFAGVPKKLVELYLGTDEGRNLIIRPYRWDYFDETNLPEVNKKRREDLDTIALEFFYKAIRGEVDIDTEWDKYVATWLKAGGQNVIEELNKAPLVSELRKKK